MKSFKQFLAETIEFNYSQTIKRDWVKLTEDAMQKFNIHFDLENYDPMGEVKIYKPNKDTSFNYQMQSGGGDWQTPTRSFRVQLTKGYLKDLSTYGKTGGCFIYIPNFEEGNDNLVKTDKDKWVPMDDTSKYKRQDERKLVKSLKAYLDQLVAQYEAERNK